MYPAHQHEPVGRAVSESPPKRSIQYQPLVIVCGAVIFGILLDRWLTFVWSVEAYWILAFACLMIWALVTWKFQWEQAGSWLLLCSVGLCAAAWHHDRWCVYSIHEMSRYADITYRPACIEAIAKHAPRRTPALPPSPLRAIPVGEGSQLMISFCSIRIGREWRPAAGDCLLRVDGHVLGIHAGDRIRVHGSITRPQPARNPGEFDFQEYNRADRRLIGMHARFPECVQVVAPGRIWSLQRWIDSVRQAARNMLFAAIGQRRIGLAAAVLLGAREGLPSMETESFLMTGTVHLLVVSGLHVGILAMGLFFALGWGIVPRNIALMAAMILVGAYALIADARPPVLRAAVLVTLVCVAMWSGRRAVAYNCLAAASLVVLAINPCELFRTGTQLSFLSVGMLIWYNRHFIQRKTTDPLDLLIAQSEAWPIRAARYVGGWIGHIILATLVVWLAALPLVLHQFHIAAPIAIPLSPLVWLLIWAALVSGFLLLLVGWLAPLLAWILGILCNGALAGLEGLIEVAKSIPGGHFWWPGPDMWWIIGFYALLIGGQVPFNSIARRRWRIAVWAIWISCGLMFSLWRTANRQTFQCSFVAIGHGTCAVIETPGGKTILYDAGNLGSPNQGAQTIAACLWSRGITRIDGIVLSHADIDHYNAVPDLLPRFDIGAVFVSPVMFDPINKKKDMDAPQFLQDALRDASIPVHQIHAGDQLNLGEADLQVEVLHPPRRGVAGSDNANSIVLLVTYRGWRMLLPGDLDSLGLDALFAELPIDCDIILAPHH
ncbi:MAG: ComEC/Rec2 family competence protein, partial [Pirellulales bacterium]|nr:ComEC/Rec2 family competence protein [Pirellulales bacterium]